MNTTASPSFMRTGCAGGTIAVALTNSSDLAARVGGAQAFDRGPAR